MYPGKQSLREYTRLPELTFLTFVEPELVSMIPLRVCPFPSLPAFSRCQNGHIVDRLL